MQKSDNGACACFRTFAAIFASFVGKRYAFGKMIKQDTCSKNVLPYIFRVVIYFFSPLSLSYAPSSVFPRRRGVIEIYPQLTESVSTVTSVVSL